MTPEEKQAIAEAKKLRAFDPDKWDDQPLKRKVGLLLVTHSDGTVKSIHKTLASAMAAALAQVERNIAAGFRPIPNRKPEPTLDQLIAEVEPRPEGELTPLPENALYEPEIAFDGRAHPIELLGPVRGELANFLREAPEGASISLYVPTNGVMGCHCFRVCDLRMDRDLPNFDELHEVATHFALWPGKWDQAAAVPPPPKQWVPTEDEIKHLKMLAESRETLLKYKDDQIEGLNREIERLKTSVPLAPGVPGVPAMYLAFYHIESLAEVLKRQSKDGMVALYSAGAGRWYTWTVEEIDPSFLKDADVGYTHFVVLPNVKDWPQ